MFPISISDSNSRFSNFAISRFRIFAMRQFHNSVVSRFREFDFAIPGFLYYVLSRDWAISISRFRVFAISQFRNFSLMSSIPISRFRFRFRFRNFVMIFNLVFKFISKILRLHFPKPIGPHGYHKSASL